MPIKRGETDPHKRRTRVFVVQDDGVTALDKLTAFAAGDLLVDLGVGGGLVDAGGGWLNSGYDGDWVYTWTAAEVLAASNQLAFVVVKAGTRFNPVAVELYDDTVSSDMQKILGLLHHNALVDGGPGQVHPLYSDAGVLILARIRAFASGVAMAAANPGAADDADGETFRANVTSADIGGGMAGLMAWYRLRGALP